MTTPRRFSNWRARARRRGGMPKRSCNLTHGPTWPSIAPPCETIPCPLTETPRWHTCALPDPREDSEERPKMGWEENVPALTPLHPGCSFLSFLSFSHTPAHQRALHPPPPPRPSLLMVRTAGVAGGNPRARAPAESGQSPRDPWGGDSCHPLSISAPPIESPWDVQPKPTGGMTSDLPRQPEPLTGVLFQV